METYMVVTSFFFQAEDGIRDIGVTGVQTCALPIYHAVVCAMAVSKFHVGRQFKTRSALAVESMSNFASCTACGSLLSSQRPGQCFKISWTRLPTERLASVSGPKLKESRTVSPFVAASWGWFKVAASHR